MVAMDKYYEKDKDKDKDVKAANTVEERPYKC